MFFVITSTKLGRFWKNLVHRCLNKFAAKSCKRFPPHLNYVSTLPCETWNAHQTRTTIELLQKVTTEYHTSTAASKFARFESSWLQRVRIIARKDVQNTHHWSGRTETDLRTKWCKAGSCHCGSHSSVALQISDECFVHPIFLLQYFSSSVIKWIQIWWIWRSHLRWDKFWSFFL